VVRLDLSGAPEVLTMLSGRESSVRRLDMLRAAVGDDPAEWFPPLTGRVWPGEAGDASNAELPIWQAAE
jgi:type IV secretion system protein VirB4